MKTSNKLNLMKNKKKNSIRIAKGYFYITFILGIIMLTATIAFSKLLLHNVKFNTKVLSAIEKTQYNNKKQVDKLKQLTLVINKNELLYHSILAIVLFMFCFFCFCCSFFFRKLQKHIMQIEYKSIENKY